MICWHVMVVVAGSATASLMHTTPLDPRLSAVLWLILGVFASGFAVDEIGRVPVSARQRRMLRPYVLVSVGIGAGFFAYGLYLMTVFILAAGGGR